MSFAQFLRRWDQFREFLSAEGLPLPRVEAFELTYVNLISASGASFPRDIWRFLNFYNQLPVAASGESPRVLNLKVGWPIGHGVGKLSLDVKHGKRETQPSEEVLIADFTARGEVNKNSLPIEAWFEAAHAAIVSTFDSLTTREAHQQWGKTE